MQITLKQTDGKEPMKTLSVNVTADIVNSAQPCNWNKCMVAEAIQQKFPSATHVFVDTTAIRFTYKGLRYYFIPPQNVKDFIVKFDRHETVQPFKFTTTFRARVIPAGFWTTHKADNRTNPNKQYDPAQKKRKYAKRVRVNGVCSLVAI